MKRCSRLIVVFCVARALSASADINGSILMPEAMYIRGKTNTIVLRCECTSPDNEWIKTIGLQYVSNTYVIAGNNSAGNKGTFLYSGGMGEAATAQWDSDDLFWGALSSGHAAWLTNTVYVGVNVTGDVALTYWLLGDSGSGMTNMLTLKEFVENVYLTPKLQTDVGNRGQSNSYSLTMRNLTGAADGFILSYSGDHPDAQTGPTNIIALAKDASTTLAVYVTLATNASGGETYTSIILAHSITNASITNTATIITSCSGIDWAQMTGPATILTQCSYATPLITGTLQIAGATGSTAAPATGVQAEVGYGPRNSHPTNGWLWYTAPYIGPAGTSNDLFATNLYLTTAGDYDYAFRFRKDSGPWLYADLDGTLNGYSTAKAGKMTKTMCPPIGKMVYQQTLPIASNITSASCTNANIGTALAADDITLTHAANIYSVRWKGQYNPAHPRDSGERGFWVYFFDNELAGGGYASNHPGAMRMAEFHAGYACELLTNTLYLYTLNLASPFSMQPYSTYWFAVQCEAASTSLWGIAAITNVIGMPSLTWQPGGLWSNAFAPQQYDLGFELYGTAMYPQIQVRGAGVTIANNSLTPSPSNHTDLGNISLGASVTQDYTIANIGDGPLLLTDNPAVGLLGMGTAQFAVTEQPTSPVNGNTSTTFRVVFLPMNVGNQAVMVSIPNDTSNNNPYTFLLQGTGATPDMRVKGNGVHIPSGSMTPLLTNNTDFGDVDVDGGTVTHTFVIENAGKVPLALTGIPPVQISGTTDYSVTIQPASPLEYSSSTVFSIAFNPSLSNNCTAMVTIANNAPTNNPYTFAIRGTGVPEPILFAFSALCGTLLAVRRWKVRRALWASLVALTLLSAARTFAGIAGSSLTALSEYVPGVTNALAFRCDCLATDNEWLKTISVFYPTNSTVDAGYASRGNQNILNYTGQLGPGVTSIWTSAGTYGAISHGYSAYVTNDVYMTGDAVGDLVLNYALEGDFGGAASGAVTIHKKMTFVLSPTTQTSTGVPTAILPYQITIQNLSDTNSGYQLFYRGAGAEWAQWGPSNVSSVAGNSSTTFAVYASAPANALAGELHTSVVSAVMASAPGVTNAVQVISVCTWEQAFLREKFEGTFPPAGWSLYIMSVTGGWQQVSPGMNSSNAAAHSTYAAPCHNWLVAPALNVNTGIFDSLVASFDSWVTKPNNLNCGVMISTGSRDPNDKQYLKLYDIPATDPTNGYVNVGIDFINYLSTNTVNLAFRYTSTGAGAPEWFVDNVCVTAEKLGFNWGKLMSPEATTTAAYNTITNIVGQLYSKGESGGASPVPNITAQVGFGPRDTYPNNQWVWQSASYAGSAASNDVYRTNIVPTVSGEYDLAYRFRRYTGPWYYADLDGGSTPYQPGRAGKLSLLMPAPLGVVVYSNAMPEVAGGIANSCAGSSNQMLTADDFSFAAWTRIQSVRWSGQYTGSGRTDAGEQGILLRIYQNAASNAFEPFNHPGAVLYEQYMPGYAYEKEVANGLYLYHANLATPFTAPLGSTYWFSVQMMLVNTTAYWGVAAASAGPPSWQALQRNGTGAWYTAAISNNIGFVLFGDTVFPIIKVFGKGVLVPNGSFSPIFSNGTYLGDVPVDGAAVTQSFTVYNDGYEPLVLTGTPRVALLGDVSDFAVSVQPASPVDARSSNVFSVVFNPTVLATRTVNVIIPNNDTAENPYLFLVRGEGVPEPATIVMLITCIGFFTRRSLSTRPS